MEISNIVEICVRIDIAILSIAYPIVISQISNIGEKYNSNYLSELFKNEFPQKVVKILGKEISIFTLTLAVTITLFLFLIFEIKPLFGGDYWLINNSAKLLVFTSTVFLIVFFFLWIDKLILYKGKPTSLLNYLIKQYKAGSSLKKYHLMTINEFTYYALKKQDEHLLETLSKFYYEEFAEIKRIQNSEEPLIFPFYCYEIINRICFSAAEKKSLNLSHLESYAISGSFFINNSNAVISQETYSNLWRNLNLICKNREHVLSYWSVAFQYYDFDIRSKNKYEYPEKEVVLRNEERKNFFEFHTALGGILLYNKQYRTISELFEYTQTQPPRYVLFPNSMNEIFEWFEIFNERFGMKISIKYGFLGLDAGLTERRSAPHWICQYIALLFIRLFSLHKYMDYQNFTSQPSLPSDVSALLKWQDSIDYFERIVEKTIKDTELIKCLNYSQLIVDRGEEITSFSTILRESIKNRIVTERLTAPLSDEKVEIFYQNTSYIIKKTFSKLRDVVGSPSDGDFDKDSLKIFIQGSKQLHPRTSFIERDIPHMNYDTIYANNLSDEINLKILNSFFIAKTRSYLLKEEDILKGIKKLGVNEQSIIIAVNASRIVHKFGSLKATLKTMSSNIFNASSSLFILKKADLPSIYHQKLSQEEIDENQYRQLDPDIRLYASVIDLDNEKKKLWQNNDEEIVGKVQVNIAFCSRISWKKNRDVVQLNIESPYVEKGTLNTIDDIIPFKKSVIESHPH